MENEKQAFEIVLSDSNTIICINELDVRDLSHYWCNKSKIYRWVGYIDDDNKRVFLDDVVIATNYSLGEHEHEIVEKYYIHKSTTDNGEKYVGFTLPKTLDIDCYVNEKWHDVVLSNY